jgi:hypothetical protein
VLTGTQFGDCRTIALSDPDPGARAENRTSEAGAEVPGPIVGQQPMQTVKCGRLCMNGGHQHLLCVCGGDSVCVVLHPPRGVDTKQLWSLSESPISTVSKGSWRSGYERKSSGFKTSHSHFLMNLFI